MGMFDYVIIDPKQLPVTHAERKVIKKNNVRWQTKDFEQGLFIYNITKDGSIEVNKWEMEWKKVDKSVHPMGICWEPKNEQTEKLDITETINFYSNVGNVWYEFYANFKNGKMKSIRVTREKFNNL